MNPLWVCAVVLAGVAAVFPGVATAQSQKKKAPKRPPDRANVSYGPHSRHVIDLWQAPAEEPTPLVVYIHGGGFRGGSKESLSGNLLRACLDAGLSVMAINYRLSPEVHFPDHYIDCARAIQFARHHAREWHLDPRRVGATGGSAGAGTSLWLGFHDDMADPNSDDPVLRQSTRLSCLAVQGAQSTYDPREIKKIVGGRAHEHAALEGFYGLKRAELDTPKAYELYEAASPIRYLGPGDPPVYAYYTEGKGPLPEDAPPGVGIHHPNFGKHLQEHMDKLGIECIVRHADEGTNVTQEMVLFFKRHLAHAARDR
ncbi:MAG: alpha/beta hydrolase [Pirellulaceae bacterium]